MSDANSKRRARMWARQKKGGDDDAGQDSGGKDDDAGQGSGGENDADVQAAIDRVIARERTRREKALEKLEARYTEKVKSYEERLAELEERDEGTEDLEARFNERLSEMKDSLDTATSTIGTLRSRIAETQLQAIAAELSEAPDDVAKLLRDRVAVGEDGAVEVYTDSGEVAYGPDGEPKTVRSLVEGFLEARPFLKKSKTRRGGGFNDAGPTDPKPLRDQIAKLESEGNLTQARRLKTKLLTEGREKS